MSTRRPVPFYTHGMELRNRRSLNSLGFKEAGIKPIQ